MEDLDPISSISAVTLLTADMDEAVGFYRALGFALVHGGGGAPFSTFRVGEGFLNLQVDPAGVAPRTVWGRVVFWVVDVDETYQRVVEAGFIPQAPPADASWGERYFHVRDPDGHELSFARPLQAG